MWRLLGSLALVFAGALLASAAQSDSSSRAASVKVEPAKGDYILQPQDLIRVIVHQEDDLTREVRLSQEASVELPLIGTIDLTGKSARQAEQYIRDLYLKGEFLAKPQVNINVLEYAPRTVKVYGAVNTPGVVTFKQEQPLNLLDAISMAGSFSRLANKQRVTLKRTNPDGTVETQMINAEELLKGDTNQQWPLKPGDDINVPERVL